MNSQKPIIIQSPHLQQNLETISQGYPHLTFEQQCKGQEFRQAANQIMLDVASHTMKLIKDPEKTAVALAWRSSLPFAESFKEFGINNFVHFNVHRDEETLQPICTYQSPISDSINTIIAADPMLATAGTAKYMFESLNTPNRKFIFTSVISAPEGILEVNNLNTQNPYPIVTARLDSHLNEVGYIVPGIGDFGDKWFYNLDIHAYLQTLVQAEIINEFERELLIHRAEKAN
jgi:uracil phosphoribosyltransferase